MPTIWDETIVLSGSEIMDAAAIARRNGDTWFIGIVNDEIPRTFNLNFSFLDADVFYDAVLVKDKKYTKVGWDISDVALQQNNNISIYLRSEGGFIAKIVPRN
jgi:alpha-glucosidase